MSRSERTFEDKPAVREQVPLIVGLTGPSSSGKTFSALRLAAGIQKVRGGDVWGVDAEGGRMAHYAEYFKFRHVRFDPPHGPADYEAAINHCYEKGARIIVVDSMSHEHDGEGGVLDQIDDFLTSKCGDDWKARERMNFVAQVRPKAARKALNRRILQLSDVTFLLCYRAQQKIKPRKGSEPDNLGWQPITTSPLAYEMILRFLLGPGSEGVPTLLPENAAEQLAVKIPQQFKGWFKPGVQLSEDIGEKLAKWAQGGSSPVQPASKPAFEWKPRLREALAGLKLGIAEVEKRGLKGEARKTYLLGQFLLYASWCAGREINAIDDLTADEAALTIQRAEAGDLP